MYDILPFPNINGVTLEEVNFQVNNYLTQLKETLEFALTDISVENLSQELVTKLNELGANIEENKENQEDQMSQVVNKSLSVSDVINSPLFATSVSNEVSEKMDNVKFSVNFNTGNLEYITS